MQRSGIRDRTTPREPPDSASLHPGYLFGSASPGLCWARFASALRPTLPAYKTLKPKTGSCPRCRSDRSRREVSAGSRLTPRRDDERERCRSDRSRREVSAGSRLTPCRDDERERGRSDRSRREVSAGSRLTPCRDDERERGRSDRLRRDVSAANLLTPFIVI
jgi:hypothetical protein